MTLHHCGCLICGSPLVYSEEQSKRICSICGGTFVSDAECEQGHYVCDGCHSKASLLSLKERCLLNKSNDPVKIFLALVSSPEVHMHGPEHHVLVGAALLTAVRNAGEGFDLGEALAEMEKRGSQVPGGVCGFWGACGAAISCGTAFSILSGSTPLAKEEWRLSNLMTSNCLEAIGKLGGPRCCKRDGITSLLAATEFLKDTLGLELGRSEDIVCSYSSENLQCIGRRCPYHKNDIDT